MAALSRISSRRGRFSLGLAVCVVGGLMLCGLTAAALVLWLKPPDKSNPSQPPQVAELSGANHIPGVPRRVRTGGYLSSDACRECHPGEHQSWHASYHRTMTQVATPQTILAPFDNVHLQSRNRQYQLERRGDEFWVTMADPEWETYWKSAGEAVEAVREPPLVTRQIVMTTGSHNLQGYWLLGSDGRELWQLPWWFLIAERRWIPREDAFLAPASANRHWVMWNNKCIQCHAVAGYPGVDFAAGTMRTEVAELGIACEACHGPGETHVRKHRAAGARSAAEKSTEADPTIFNPKKHPTKVATEVCAQCHSYFHLHDEKDFLQHGVAFRPGDRLSSTRDVVRFDQAARAAGAKSNDAFQTQGFWPDGTCRVGGDEYQGLLESACFQRGELSCLSCHSLHDSDPNDQLARDRLGNEACLQCHAEYRERIEQHTHHAPSSSGSECLNCHMPHTTLALLTAMRSHRIDSPRIDPREHGARPNACNLCHLDQTLQWTAEQLSAWYGAEPVELSDEQRTRSAALLWLLQGDAAQRAVTAWSFGWPSAQQAAGSDWQSPHLATLLDDPYPAVRLIAWRSLRRQPAPVGGEFDPLGDSTAIESARQQLLREWQPSIRPRDANQARRLLLLQDGSLDESAVQLLLHRRDDSPVNIME